jgi:L-lactate dehydrogenase complex protein LldG
MTTDARTADAREAILERIRSALGEAAAAAPADVARSYRVTAPDGTDMVELFAERVADYRATVHRVPADRLAATVASALSGRGARRLVVPTGLPEPWLAETASIDRLADDPPLTKADLDAADGVITGCAVAIAETGTIVLDGDEGQGRRALSLLPDYHLCIVPVERIVGSVPEALARLDSRRPLTWISGPSATSDIELERVEGVHGPRNLEVVIVEG